MSRPTSRRLAAHASPLVTYRVIQVDGSRLETVQFPFRHKNCQTTDLVYSQLIPL